MEKPTIEPKASIIMPAYNAGGTIRRAIESVLAQTEPAIELVVCNDASNDDTLKVIESINDPRIKLIKNSVNSGPGAARDRAISAASAPWIALMDADDAWHPSRLQHLLAVANEAEDVMVFDDIMTCHDVNGELIPWRSVHGARAFGNAEVPAAFGVERYLASPRLLIKPLIPARLIRQSGLKHSNKRFGEDAEFFLRLAAAGCRFKYVPKALYFYRVAAGSATGQNRDHSVMRKMLESCREEHDWPVQADAAFARKISRLHADEAIYKAAEELSNRQPFRAVCTLATNPRALIQLPNRTWRRFRYEISRRRHGAAQR